MGLASQFRNLFQGLERAHGEFRLTGRTSAAGKKEGKAQTVSEPVTEELWQQHLDGEVGLGVVPVTDEATCCWGAIDVDVYEDLDLAHVERQVNALGLPLVVVRSKSGGAHLYAFFKEFGSAATMRSKLMEMAVALGYSGVEVFPKQARLASCNDVGNWINMPYFKGDLTDRYAVQNGDFITPQEFVALAYERAVTEDELAALDLSGGEDDLLEGGPPCLQTLAARGFPEGSRNNGLYSIAVFLKKKYGDQFESYLDEANQRFMDPPLGSGEVQQVAKSVRRKDYGFKCREQPIVSVCNSEICRSRPYGIAGAQDDPGLSFDTLTKVTTDPPIWILGVNGVRMELSTEQLKDFARFESACMERLTMMPNPMRQNAWKNLVRRMMENCEVVEAPEEASQEGMVRAHLEAFCTDNAQARQRDELLRGLPWTSEGWTYFRATDLMKFLDQQRVRVGSESRLWQILRHLGATHTRFNIKGKECKCWAVPAFEQQSEGHEVPRPEESEI